MRQAILIALAAVAVVGAVIFGISRVADVSPLDKEPVTPQATAQDWERDATGAFGGTDISQHVIQMVEAAREWTVGAQSTDEFRATLAQRHQEFVDVKDRLDRLRDFPNSKLVRPLYLDSAQLYLETVNVYRAMTDTPAGDLRTQLDLMAKRLRALADRVFDRGHELVKPALGEKPDPNVDIRLPAEVPDWAAEGMAPGPPLDDPPPPPSEEPQLRQTTRPDQPRDQWLAALRALDLPKPSLDDPKETARRLVAAVARLGAVPDPKGDREESARIRLALLVQADAARAAQAGLGDVGRRLLVVGDRLWSGPGLPARSSGVDPAVLRQS
jgi:hypothetical protein